MNKSLFLENFVSMTFNVKMCKHLFFEMFVQVVMNLSQAMVMDDNNKMKHVFGMKMGIKKLIDS
jgi:hypothetical protein